jgi:hypothetical protein
MPNPAKYVQPIHFEDFSGAQFERLVFAYHARSDKWRSLEWYGQAGNDLGRDIWGIRENDTHGGESVCIQCVNRKSLVFAKAQKDVLKVLKSDHGIPQRFRIVAASDISAKMRDRIKSYVKSLGVLECDLWSGSEFEEFLRRGAEAILKRFVEGEVFPDSPEELMNLGEKVDPVTDDQALALFARVFDRAAFYTPLTIESNLGDFKQAITDTIQALGTGIWKARDGHLIDRIPSRHQLKSEALRQKLQSVEIALARLRGKFDEMTRSGVVKHCSCNDPKCTAYFMPHLAADELEILRSRALEIFRDVYPAFSLPSW